MDRLPPIPPRRKRPRDGSSSMRSSRRHGGLSSASLRYADDVLLQGGASNSSSNLITASTDPATKQLGRRLAMVLAVLGFTQLAQLFDVSLSTFRNFLPSMSTMQTRTAFQHRSLRMRRQLAAPSSSSRTRPSNPTAAGGGGDSDSDSCPLSRAIQPTERIATPVPIASYPGSGAKMTWMLVETLTGLVTADEHRLNGNPWDRAISVKSHWPHPHGAARLGAVLDRKSSAATIGAAAAAIGEDATSETDGVSFPRAVLLLRHPLGAIPSLHNFLNEEQTGSQGHTVRAPLDRWQTWLGRNFEAELKAWEDHLVYWMDRYGAHERLVLTYEGLTDEVEGPRSSAALMEFLSLAVKNTDAGWEPRADAEVACIWRKMVQYKRRASDENNAAAAAAAAANDAPPPVTGQILFHPSNPVSHRSGSDYRPYSQGQLGQMADMLRRLQGRYGGDEQVAPILEVYLQRVVASLASPIATAAFEQ
jgi:hypothetical protein